MSTPDVDVDWERISAVQDEITRWADEQFPGRTDHQTLYKLVLHEVPELLTHKKEHGTEGIDTELADCFILLLDLASMWEVDVVKAIRAKMEVNYRRTWERDAHGIMQHVEVVQPAVWAPTRVPGCKCPTCESTEIETTAPSSTMSYHCINCGTEFDDDIPF